VTSFTNDPTPEPAASVGYIGLGNLGVHLAASLQRAGHRLVVHDLHRDAASELLAAGAGWADSPADVAASCDVVLTCLPSPAAIVAVVEGPNGILSAARPGLVWIDNSTKDRDETLRLGARCAEVGIATLEAPVTGGVHKAALGDITVLVGGDVDLFAAHRHLLEAIGNPVLHLGGLGDAAVVKVITNMLAFIHLVADGEALMLARRAGIDLGAAWEAITNSSGSSFVHETEGKLILNGSYDVGFSMDLALKDLGFAAKMGREFGVPLDLAGMTHQTFVRGRSAYGGEAQSTQIVKLLEDALGTDLRAPGFPPRLTDE
jgi:3-hydroxyisobutyrate dehydrogenase